MKTPRDIEELFNRVVDLFPQIKNSIIKSSEEKKERDRKYKRWNVKRKAVKDKKE